MTNKQFADLYVKYVKYASTEVLNIETTYRCPLQCPFCQRQEEGDVIKKRISQSKDIPFDDLKKLLNYSDCMTFCGQLSDPIYHEDFLGILSELKKYPTKLFYISTNGTRKKREWWESAFKLTTPNVRWIFGLDGTDQDTAEIYRVNTNFQDVMEVMKLGSSMGCRITWQFIVFKHNEHQIEEAKRIAKENNLNLKIEKSGRWLISDMEKYKIYPPSEQWKSFNSITKNIMIINKI